MYYLTHHFFSVIKSLSQLAFKMRQSTKTHPIEYSQFKHVHGPYVLFSRVLVLAAVPPNMALDGLYVLAFMQNFAPHINKHLSGLWDQRIPLLQHYLEQTKAIDQAQWEEWLLTLMDDTLGEIDLDEWNTALIGAMTQQLTGLYSGMYSDNNGSHSGPENYEKSRPKNLVKSNISISKNIFLTKFHFLQFLKWPKINF